MNLKLTLTDQRSKNLNQQWRGEFEDYTRAELDATGSSRVIANTLRALADDLDPEFRFLEAQTAGVEPA